MPIDAADVSQMIRYRRRITGMSAILLPFLDDRSVDWRSFESHVQRTCDAGLIPAVNMDTGFINLLNEADRNEVLVRTKAVTAGTRFLAGAFVKDSEGDQFRCDEYRRRIDEIQAFGGTPVIFPSYGLTRQADDDIVASYEQLAQVCDRFVGFELGAMFAPFGRIYSADVFRGLLELKPCIGAKHSSLRRDLEWERLRMRDQIRPDFMILTGNDLAIDMVMYGSDYLLGLSTFAPDFFSKRDALWERGDASFHQLNDVLQYLGFFAFRNPVPAYRHSAAMFLQLRGWIRSSRTHSGSPVRPESDLLILRELLEQLEAWSRRG